jgi:prepilin-type N-terminal cleavage/methylation domain-containing protein
MRKLIGFTLIELLIVVAIIAILAAIAVPNFLEAQTRSKVSRCRADMRTIKVGIEAYHVDNNKYPPASEAKNMYYGYYVISTPVPYLATIPVDVFKLGQPTKFQYGPQFDWTRIPEGYAGDKGAYFAGWNNPANGHYHNDRMVWQVSSPGPNIKYDFYEYPTYDATNGTVSNGELFEWGP